MKIVIFIALHNIVCVNKKPVTQKSLSLIFIKDCQYLVWKAFRLLWFRRVVKNPFLISFFHILKKEKNTVLTLHIGVDFTLLHSNKKGSILDSS